MRDGLGALYERFEALKNELAEMGMFAPEYKQPIPRYIRTLGVVTAPTGAAVRDIITLPPGAILLCRSSSTLRRCRGRAHQTASYGGSVCLSRKNRM